MPRTLESKMTFIQEEVLTDANAFPNVSPVCVGCAPLFTSGSEELNGLGGLAVWLYRGEADEWAIGALWLDGSLKLDMGGRLLAIKEGSWLVDTAL